MLFTILPNQSTHAESEHDIELWNVIKPLETTVSFVNTGAHPDDERSDFLAYLSRGRGIETHSIIATRGEGGQNQIGKELGNALGVIRTNEMAEAAEVTNVQAHHLSENTEDSIYDFGFSKTPEETLEIWGEKETYKRFIRLIRELKPDIIMPSFRDVDAQHGHHRAMTVLSMRAFEDAANPDVFPEQITDEGLSPWQPKKLYLPSGDDNDVTHSFEIGIVDPVYDMTYPQIGEESRSLHKSQGMGVDLPVEPRQFNLELIKNETDASSDDFFSGIPYDFQEWAKIITDSEISQELKNLQVKLEATIDAYPNRSDVFTASQEALEQLETVQNLVERSNLDLKDDVQHKLSIKKEQLAKANFVAANLNIDIDFDSTTFVQGQEVEAEITIENQGDHPINDLSFKLIGPKDWNINHENNRLHVKRDENDQTVITIQAPEDADYYNPYADPIFNSNISYSVHDTKIEHTFEIDETIAVLPEIGLTIDPEDLIINTTDFPNRIPVTVEAKNYTSGALEANVDLNAPKEWEVVDQNQKVKFSKPNETKKLTFELSPPKNISKDEFEIDVEAEVDGKVLTNTVQEISYDHIDQSYYIYPAKINGSAFELLYDKKLTIGYIDSGMDEVSKYLSDLGLNITEVTEEELSSGDLDKYDTIFTGIRAYLARDDLNKHNDQLLKYVNEGGHLVVQHNLPGEWDENHIAPYPLKLGTPSIDWRVTDQDSDVKILNPYSPLFHYPNKINEQDWKNWVQERGLYFPMEWDDRYETFVSMADPDQEEPFTGGILATDYGEGTYIYTSLVFYRQIQNQVPGGYRIFTNLLHYLQDDPSLAITKVESFDPIVVDKETTLNDLHLPTKAEVTLSDDSIISIPVDWDKGDPVYDKDTPGKYVFTGTLQLPEDIVNEESLKPEIVVHVKDKKPKEDPRETGGENETDEDEKVEKDENGDRNGERLPKTATQSYNMLLIGSLALLIGLSTYIWYRFQQRKQ
ncbi:MAG TPA: PIG-L family deacetylase [Candidatus Avamphibacillus sp.]|nr:PIG-L family deacetylase [Candidatus Avamphibacillus sp.]